MNDAEFARLTGVVLQYIVDTIEKEDVNGNIEIDFYGDMLNIEVGNNIFVVNRHSAAKEIWLASPVSGPYHFSYRNGNWRTKSGDDLFEILEKELNVTLKNPHDNPF